MFVLATDFFGANAMNYCWQEQVRLFFQKIVITVCQMSIDSLLVIPDASDKPAQKQEVTITILVQEVSS